MHRSPPANRTKAFLEAARKRFSNVAALKSEIDVDAILVGELDHLDTHVHGNTADIGDHGDYPCRLINGRWRYDLVTLHQNDAADNYKFDEQMAAVDDRFAKDLTAGKWTDYQTMETAREGAMPKPPGP